MRVEVLGLRHWRSDGGEGGMVCRVQDVRGEQRQGLEHLEAKFTSANRYTATAGCRFAPLIKSVASTRIYCTMSVLLEAESRTLWTSAPPASRLT